MASLQNPQKLVHSDKIDLDLQISDHKSPSSILVTHQKQRVAVYQVQDLKTSKVWSSKTGHTVVNKAVYDTQQQQYAALLSNEVLWQWKDEHSKIDKGIKVKLSKPAFSLVDGDTFGTFLVFMDGSLAHLDDVETPMTPIDAIQGPVHFCISVVYQSCLYVAVATDAGKLYVHKITSSDTSKVLQFSLPEGSVISKSTVCFHKQKSSLQLLVIGPSNTLASLNVNDGTAEWKTLPFPSAKSPCIASLGANFIAVGGLVSDGQVGLGIWDIKFGLLQNFHNIPENNSSCQQLYTIGSRLIVVCGTNIYICRFSIESNTLAAALGRQLKEGNTASLTSSSGGESKLKHLLLGLLDKLKTMKLNEMEIGLTEVANLLAKSSQQELVSVIFLVCQLLNRCAENDHLWSPDCLLKVVLARKLPARLCENFVNKAVKKEDLFLVFSCVLHLENVPEHQLVKCLNFIVKCDSNQFINLGEKLPTMSVNDDSPIKCPFIGVKAATINALLKKPYSDVFLQDCMKDMEFLSVMPLLQYLCFMLVSSSMLTTEKGLGLSVLQVIDWLNITVDAHFAQLVLSIEARKLLVDLHQTVESQVNLLEELVSLEGILNQIKKGGLPYREPPGVYNIHTLHII